MARLYRPHIPLSVRCQVAERHLSKWFPNVPFDKAAGRRLALLLDLLASKIGCQTTDLRLDHDPPLAVRPRHRKGLGKKTFYLPDANDVNHLFYRPHGAQFDGSHDVKTRIRGDHGQFSDIALIKREKRRQKEAASGKPVRKVYTNLGQGGRGKTAKAPAKYNRKYNQASTTPRPKSRQGSSFISSTDKLKEKRKWPSRPFPKRAKP